MPRASRTLPDHPDLRHLKDEAKARVRAGEFARLADAQFALAREFGLPSWPKLKARIGALLTDPAVHRFYAALHADDSVAVGAALDASPDLLDTWTDAAPWSDRYAGRAYRGGPDDASGDAMASPPLHYAAGRGAAGAARALLERGAEVDGTGYEGNIGRCTPLCLAAFTGADRIAAVRVLLEHGADPDARSGAGTTALATALDHGEGEIVEALLAAGATVSPADAVALDRPEQVAQILAGAPGVAAYRDPYRGDSLWAFARGEGMRRLLEGAGVCPSLVEAAGAGDVDWVRRLLDEDPGRAGERQVSRGPLALHLAARGGHLEVVRLLLERGADPGAEWVPGLTSLGLAERHGHEGVASLLRAATATAAASAPHRR